MQTQQWLNDFVNNVYSDLGERDDYSFNYLLAWFLDPSNLGELNNLIDTAYICAKGNNGYIYIDPEIGAEELSIYKANFEIFFYGRESKRSLATSYSSSGSWISLKDDDSSITRINRSDLARTFNLLQRDAKNNRDDLVKSYLRSKSKAQSVSGNDILFDTYFNGNNSQSIYDSRSEPI
jgi:hypothetical protein